MARYCLYDAGHDSVLFFICKSPSVDDSLLVLLISRNIFLYPFRLVFTWPASLSSTVPFPPLPAQPVEGLLQLVLQRKKWLATPLVESMGSNPVD